MLGLVSKFTVSRLKVVYGSRSLLAISKILILRFFFLNTVSFQSICKINNVSNVTCTIYYCTQSSCAKKVVGKFSFNELKIEKVKFFTQSPTKIVCINIFNVGGCLKICLTFRPFLT